MVHCSAGIGRTGCFIGLSIGARQLRQEGAVDVLGTVCRMRLDRWDRVACDAGQVVVVFNPRGPPRLSKGESPPSHKPGLCHCVCSGSPHRLAGSCRLRQDVSGGVRVIVCYICFCEVGGVKVGRLCALGYPLRCCRGCMCRIL